MCFNTHPGQKSELDLFSFQDLHKGILRLKSNLSTEVQAKFDFPGSSQTRVLRLKINSNIKAQVKKVILYRVCKKKKEVPKFLQYKYYSSSSLDGQAQVYTYIPKINTSTQFSSSSKIHSSSLRKFQTQSPELLEILNAM